jgi:hypothetical protein
MKYEFKLGKKKSSGIAVPVDRQRKNKWRGYNKVASFHAVDTGTANLTLIVSMKRWHWEIAR